MTPFFVIFGRGKKGNRTLVSFTIASVLLLSSCGKYHACLDAQNQEACEDKNNFEAELGCEWVKIEDNTGQERCVPDGSV